MAQFCIKTIFIMNMSWMISQNGVKQVYIVIKWPHIDWDGIQWVLGYEWRYTQCHMWKGKFVYHKCGTNGDTH